MGRNALVLSKLAGMIASKEISSTHLADALDGSSMVASGMRRMSTTGGLKGVSKRASRTGDSDLAPMDLFDEESGDVNRYALDNIFDVFDVDKSGYLDEIETEKFVKVVFMSNGEAVVPAALLDAIARARKKPTSPRGGGGGFCEPSKQPPDVIDKENFVDLIVEFLAEDAKAQEAEAAKQAELEVESVDYTEEPEVSLFMAITMIIAGALFASFFSDAMVDSIDSFGGFSGIPNFVIGFVVCPLASNASETISSFQLAARKKIRNASVTFAQIYAACTMNNCTCLGIFFFMVWYKQLSWDYGAEV